MFEMLKGIICKKKNIYKKVEVHSESKKELNLRPQEGSLTACWILLNNNPCKHLS